jgi:uncharacterized lipoprotein YehR (DUF1307 family)
MKSNILFLILILIVSIFSCQQEEISLSKFIKHHTGKSVKIAILKS